MPDQIITIACDRKTGKPLCRALQHEHGGHVSVAEFFHPQDFHQGPANGINLVHGTRLDWYRMGISLARLRLRGKKPPRKLPHPSSGKRIS